MSSQRVMALPAKAGAAVAVLLLCMAACRAETRMIEKLPVLDGAAAVAQGELTNERAKLRQDFSHWLRGAYAIEGERDFAISGPHSEWAAVRKHMDNALGSGCQLQQPDWYRPGYDLFAVWKCGGLLRTRFVGLALSNEADASGRRALAYYDLKPAG